VSLVEGEVWLNPKSADGRHEVLAMRFDHREDRWRSVHQLNVANRRRGDSTDVLPPGATPHQGQRWEPE
jgi:hypothetical protein